MTIQEKTAERIYEILPHKKELEFGCVVEVNVAGYNNCIYNIEYIKPNTEYFDGNIIGELILDSYYGGDRAKSFTIIGQPIRLADILLAISKIKNKKEDIGYSDWYDQVKQITWDSNGYNLSQDNLLNQSDETAQFIYDILK